MPDREKNYRGILAITGGCAFFSATDATAKISAKYLPVSEVVAIRGAFTLLFIFLLIVFLGKSSALRRMTDPFLLARALVEACAGVVIVYSLSVMPIANVTAILLVQPFLMTAIGAVFLREIVGWRRWMAAVAGFGGMLLIIKPATAGFDGASFMALAAAHLVLMRDLLTRRIDPAISTTVVTFTAALASVPIGLAGALIEPWQTPELFPFVIAALSAVFLVAASILMVIAYRGTDVSAVSPFRYSVVVFAAVFGFLLFGEVPDMASFAGMGIIVAAGLYVLRYEGRERKGRSSAGRLLQ